MTRKALIKRLLEISEEETKLKSEKNELRAKLQQEMVEEDLKSIKGSNYTVSISDESTKYVLRNQEQIIQGLLEDGDPEGMLMEKKVPSRMTIRKKKAKQ